MRVKCIKNKPGDAKGTHKYLGSGTGNDRGTYKLTIGKEYIVYAIATIENETMYLLVDEFHTAETHEILKGYAVPRPMWYDAKLCEVVDDSIDPSWQKSNQDEMWSKGEQIYSFPEFVADKNEFYTWLIEGRQREVDIFKQYMRKYEDPNSLDTEEADKKRAWEKYEKDLKNAQEKGWELPEKPEEIE